MKPPLLLCIILIASCAAAQGRAPLELIWDKPLINGADSIQLMDFDGDGVMEIYVVSLHPSRTLLSVYNINSSLMWDTVIEKPQVQHYPSEEVMIVKVGDLDGDENFDIIAGSQIHSGSVNIHPLYYIERERERGLSNVYNRVKWTFDDSRLATSIEFDVENGMRRLIVSSNDFNVYIVGADGTLIDSINLGYSVWSSHLADVDNDSESEIIVGTFNGISFLDDGRVNWTLDLEDRITSVYVGNLLPKSRYNIIGASRNKLYVLDIGGQLIWRSNLTDLSSNVIISDLEGDGINEILLGSANVLLLYNNNGSVKWRFNMGRRILAIASLDINEDGKQDILIGTNKGLFAYALGRQYLMLEDAKSYYALALMYHSAGEYPLAVNFLKKSMQFYDELNESEIVENISRLFIVYENNLLDYNFLLEAESYLTRAKVSYEIDLFADATYSLREAQRIYLKFNSSEGLREVELLNYSIIMKPQAEEYAIQAEKAYLDNDFKTALELALKAKEIFVNIDGSAHLLLKIEPIIRLSHEKIDQPDSTITTVKPSVPYLDQEKVDYSTAKTGVVILVIVVSAIILFVHKRSKNKRRRNI